MARFAVVVVHCDSWLIAEENLEFLRENSNPELTNIILVDNGSVTAIYPELFPENPKGPNTTIHFPQNIGGNATFHDPMILSLIEESGAEFVAFLHNDMMIREPNWDKLIIEAFDSDPKLGLIGVVGSNEIDAGGGRGLGTTLSFMGYEYRTIWASKAEIHGKRAKGISPAAVLDHCCMIFRLSVLKEIPPAVEIHTPGHFYDRIACCEVLSRGHRIAVYGIACDHQSGGIGIGKLRTDMDHVEPGIANQNALYTKWLIDHNLPFDPVRPDNAIYVEGERRFLSKWRDQLHFLPVRVSSDYTVTHLSPLWKGM